MLGECMPSRAGSEVVRGRVRGVDVALSKTRPRSGAGGGDFPYKEGEVRLRCGRVGLVIGACGEHAW